MSISQRRVQWRFGVKAESFPATWAFAGIYLRLRPCVSPSLQFINAFVKFMRYVPRKADLRSKRLLFPSDGDNDHETSNFSSSPVGVCDGFICVVLRTGAFSTRPKPSRIHFRYADGFCRRPMERGSAIPPRQRPVCFHRRAGPLFL